MISGERHRRKTTGEANYWRSQLLAQYWHRPSRKRAPRAGPQTVQGLLSSRTDSGENLCLRRSCASRPTARLGEIARPSAPSLNSPPLRLHLI